jgi:1A family penicillin-binding protein
MVILTHSGENFVRIPMKHTRRHITASLSGTRRNSVKRTVSPSQPKEKVESPVVAKTVATSDSLLSRLDTTGSASWQKAWNHKAKAHHEKWIDLKTQLKRQSHPFRAWLQQHTFLRTILRVMAFPIRNKWARWVTLLCVLSMMAGIVYLLRDVPSPRRLTSKENFAVSTQIFDRNGVLLYEIFGDEHRIPIKVAELPPYVAQASIAIEDQHFYSHFGFDVWGILRAVINNFQGKPLEGGSTITQQLVKNALLTNERSFTRKVKEGLLAIMTEVIYTKQEILEMYLNYISYGGTSVGVEAAAQSYFDKSAKDLTLAEAALLAGLPQAPSRYSPFGSNPLAAKERQAEVLRRMVEDGYITPLQAEDAKSQTLTYALKKTDIQAPHFVFYVRDLLYEKYGVETVEKGGLRVQTSLDLNLQNMAQASVSAEVEKLSRFRVGNGSALILKPNTGEVLAMVGSKDYFDIKNDGQVNVTLAQRQPGSSIKPIMYATAFQEKILNPGTILLDVPTCFQVPGQKPYCPKNYDGSFRGPVPIRQAVGNSLNIPAVKGLKLIGLENFIAQARSMGISSWVDPSRYGLSLTLGGGEVRMIDLAQAFTVIANQGVKVPITPILKITDYQGAVIEDANLNQRLQDLAEMTTYEDEYELGDLERVMDRAPAYLTAHIMQDNKAREAVFGARSKLVIPNQVVSAKTGTTNDLKDNWTVGFTPEFLVITWVGNNDGSAMNQAVVSGITGAAPIWNDIMTQVLAGKEPVWPEKPPSVLAGPVCATGMPPSYSGNKCGARQTELFWRDSEPSRSGLVKKQVWINPATGLPPAPGESQEGLVLEERELYQDPLTNTYCKDCARPVDESGKVQYERTTVTNESVQNTETLEENSGE